MDTENIINNLTHNDNKKPNTPMDVDKVEENIKKTDKKIKKRRFVFEDDDLLSSDEEPNDDDNNMDTESDNKNMDAIDCKEGANINDDDVNSKAADAIDLEDANINDEDVNSKDAAAIDLEDANISEDDVNSKDVNDIQSSLVSEPNKDNDPKDTWKSAAVDNANIVYIDPKESFKTRTFQYQRIESKLTSVKQLRLSIENKCNMNLREILANLIFIACIDCHRSLIQHSTKLYLCDTTRLTEELFYETILYDFQNLGLIKLSSPLPLEELFMLGLKSQEDEWNPELGDMRELSQQMCRLLVSKRDMLLEYFSLEVTEQGELSALPLLLDGHTPFMGALPTYLVRLVTEVNWDSEKECFDTFSRQTAVFYSQPNPDTLEDIVKSEMWKQEHIIFPAIRRNFLPPSSFVSNGAILQIASLADMYKVFERC